MENSLTGRFAISKAGHDKGTVYVVIAHEAQWVYLCDGRYHTLNKLKKKSLKHVEICSADVIHELKQRIRNNEKIFDHEIKYAIKLQQL